MPRETAAACGSLDLHTHSTASDGLLAPADLVAEARRCGVGVLALTDHDTLGGLPEARGAARAAGVHLVPGLELGCRETANGAEVRTDVLAYLVDPSDSALRALLEHLQVHRAERGRQMVERLRSMGAPVTWGHVEERATGGTVARPHVARALVQVGFVESVREAFDRYLGTGCPAYVGGYPLSPAEACRSVRAAGGVPVLAHPVPPDRPYSDPRRLRWFLPPLVEAGLGGLECYYPGYTSRVSRWLCALADFFGLVPTGGSDFHGADRPANALGSVAIPADTVERLERAARKA